MDYEWGFGAVLAQWPLLLEGLRGTLTIAALAVAIGLVIGIPVALFCVRSIKFVQSQLYEVAGSDAGVIATAVCTLAVAACIAGIIPARRAASIDPVKALRTE